VSGVFDPGVSSVRLGLSLLGSEPNRSILTALARRPMSQHELKAWLVIASAATLHRHLRELLKVTVVARHETRGARRRVSYELTAAGRALVVVLGVVTGWLRRHPQRSLEPVSPVGWRAFAALVTAWELGLIRHLARAPHSGAELSESVPGLSAHKAERELGRLAGAGIVQPIRGPDRQSRQALSDWGRLGIGVLAAGARWERVHIPERAKPVTVEDAAVALIAALPLTRLPADVSGVCTFAVEVGPGDDLPLRAGAVWAEVREGRIVSCAAGTAPRPPIAWAHGSIGAWLDAVIDGRPAAVQTGGEPDLAICLRQLRARLCGTAG
jgi:DNA-binding HxlR family transcriptional regulator